MPDRTDPDSLGWPRTSDPADVEVSAIGTSRTQYPPRQHRQPRHRRRHRRRARDLRPQRPRRPPAPPLAERDGRRLLARRDAELREDLRDVVLRAVERDAEPLGDLFVREVAAR